MIMQHPSDNLALWPGFQGERHPDGAGLRALVFELWIFGCAASRGRAAGAACWRSPQ